MDKMDANQLKLNNMRLVYDFVKNAESVSRADIARGTGLTKVTVSSIIAELIEDGYLDELGDGLSSGGRRPLLIQANTVNRLTIGLEMISNDNITAYLCDTKANILKRVTQPYQNTFSSIVQVSIAMIAGLIRDLPENSRVVGIGIGVAGLVDVQNRNVLYSVSFDIQGAGLVKYIEDEFSIPVFIENESNAATRAEYYYNKNQFKKNMLYISVITGIGAGIVINGQVYYGDLWGAGEIGHIPIDPGGELCSCGMRGCLETKLKYGYLLERIKRKVPAANNLDRIADLYRNLQPDICEIVDDVALQLGRTIAITAHMLDIENIVIGGYVQRFGTPFLDKVRESFGHNVLHYYGNRVNLTYGSTDKSMVGVGVALTALEQVWKFAIK